MEANQDALEHIKWNKLIKSDKGQYPHLHNRHEN